MPISGSGDRAPRRCVRRCDTIPELSHSTNRSTPASGKAHETTTRALGRALHQRYPFDARISISTTSARFNITEKKITTCARLSTAAIEGADFMTKLVFLQRQVSQLDEPVYSRIHEISPNRCHVIYWNNYGLKRKYVDPEMGVVPDFSEKEEFQYPRSWLDTKTHSALSIIREILLHQPDFVVLTDIPGRTRALLSLGLRARGVTTFLRSDKNQLSASARTGASLAFEQQIYKFVYNALAPVSPLTNQYYNWPSLRLSIEFPYTTNERKFAPPQDQRLASRQRIRAELGLGENVCVFLSAAKFVNRENPWGIIKSFEKTKTKRLMNTALVALGDGPLLDEITQYCRDRGLDNIFFPGYVPFARLQDYFFASDIFLHFAKVEPWGVSPQDALVAGLGLVASSWVGSANVLLQGPLSRFLVPLENTDEFPRRMIELANHPDIAGLFEPARNAANEFTVSSCAQRWAKLARAPE